MACFVSACCPQTLVSKGILLDCFHKIILPGNNCLLPTTSHKTHYLFRSKFYFSAGLQFPPFIYYNFYWNYTFFIFYCWPSVLRITTCLYSFLSINKFFCITTFDFLCIAYLFVYIPSLYNISSFCINFSGTFFSLTFSLYLLRSPVFSHSFILFYCGCFSRCTINKNCRIFYRSGTGMVVSVSWVDQDYFLICLWRYGSLARAHHSSGQHCTYNWLSYT